MKKGLPQFFRGKPVRESDFHQGPGYIIELVRTEDSKLRFLHVNYEKNVYSIVECLNNAKYVLLPPEDDEIARSIQFPHRPQGDSSIETLLPDLEEFLGRCLDIDDRNRFLLACFVLSTWVANDVRIAPYVSFVGLTRSGKTTALETLHLLCYRSLLVAEISPADLCVAWERFKPTLLLDDVDDANQSKALFRVLRSGTTRNSVAFRGGKSFRSFGPKAMAWRGMPEDESLISRSLVIPMRETSRRDLERTTDMPIIATAERLRDQLLQYRLENLGKLSVPKIPGQERLRTQDRDIYEALALPIAEHRVASARLIECFADAQYSSRAPLPPKETAVIETLYAHIHLRADEGTVAIQDLTTTVNLNLAKSGERFRFIPKGMGSILTKLGFPNRERQRAGFVLLIDRAARKRIHELMWMYGNAAHAVKLPSEASGEPCEDCVYEDRRHAEPSPDQLKAAPAE